jgi:enamine deaminase RidA (YjgF/YER057c/UK114 family)
VAHGVVAHGSRVLYISGQVPVDEGGALVGPGDMGRQYEQAMENMRIVVEAAGARMENVCRLVNYITVPVAEDDAAYAEIKRVRQTHFGDHHPASTLVQVVSLMVPGAMVEIEGEAVLD